MADTTPETVSPAVPDEAGQTCVWTLELPFARPPLNLNRMRGRNWAAVHSDMRTLRDAGHVLGIAKKLPRPFPFAITAELIYWPGNNSVHDPDNISPTLKPLLDGLRAAGVLTDDRGRYVRTAMCTVVERADDPTGRRDARMALVLRRA